MSNSTQKDHETHTACMDRLKKEGASVTCCYCDPHEGCTLNTPMSNSTQNKFREFVEDPDVKIMRKAADRSQKKMDEMVKDVKPDTQNDWEKEFNSKYNFKHYLSQAKFVTLMGEDMEEKLGTWDVEDLNKLLADARKEGAVLARRTNKKLVEMYIQDIGESIPSELADMALMVSRQEVIRKIMQDVALMREEDGDEGYNRACNEVLATLREEESK